MIVALSVLVGLLGIAALAAGVWLERCEQRVTRSPGNE